MDAGILLRPPFHRQTAINAQRTDVLKQSLAIFAWDGAVSCSLCLPGPRRSAFPMGRQLAHQEAQDLEAKASNVMFVSCCRKLPQAGRGTA